MKGKSEQKRSLGGALLVLLVLLLFGAGFATAQEACSDAALQESFEALASAEQHEAFVRQYAPCELAFVAVQRLARPALQARNWQGAADIFRLHQPAFPEMADRFAKIIEMLEAPSEGLAAINLGPGVNSRRGDEYRPVVSGDGETLYFGRDRGPEAGGEDIYFSVRDGHGLWGRADNLGPLISTPAHELPLAVSIDNNKLALFGNYPGGLGNGDIYFSERGEVCWGAPRAFPAPVNSTFFDSDAMFTADGRSMLLVSDRPGGVGAPHAKETFFHGSTAGNTDIYVYVDKGDGSGELVNLGPVVNTPYAEYSPFLHADGRTLYFASEGHYGLGGLDVFVSTRLRDDSWTEWSTPVNLGKEVNGPFNDWGMQIATQGDNAYFSARNDVERPATSDLYNIMLPAGARPGAVVVLRGRVTDPEGRPLGAAIKWNDLTANTPLGVAASRPDTGEYFIAVAPGRMYGYYAEKEGYVGRSENVDLTAQKTGGERVVDIVLYPLGYLDKGPLTIRLNNIFFDFDKYELRKESFLELDRWVDFLKKNTNVRADLHGHTCAIGTDAYNQKLSENRAKAVSNYLLEHGIGAERLGFKGFGESKPIASNKTSEGREQNRRVEIVLQK